MNVHANSALNRGDLVSKFISWTLCVELERNPHRGGMITLRCNVLGCHGQHNNQSNYITVIVT